MEERAPAPLSRKLASALHPTLLSGLYSGPALLLRPSPQLLFPLYPALKFPASSETMTAELRSLLRT